MGPKVLDETSNMAVIQLASRNFPGLVLQGDTLASLVGDLREADNLLKERGREDEARETIGLMRERLEDLLRHYESVLRANGIELPYRLSNV